MKSRVLGLLMAALLASFSNQAPAAEPETGSAAPGYRALANLVANPSFEMDWRE